MAKITNVFGTKFSGRIGKSMVAASWKGHEYVRTYVKPPNPNSESQRKARGTFADAVRSWRKLSKVQTEFYDKIAEGMSGFNLYISRYVTAKGEGQEPEKPVEASYVTADGQPMQIGGLIVKAGSRVLFKVSLAKARAAIALTCSDSPYTFVLTRGRAEEEVLEVRDLSVTGMPKALESEELGIKLVADIQPPPADTTGGKR